MKQTINVVIIDDNKVVTSSVKKYFWDSSRVNIVNMFSNGKDGLEYLINNSDAYDIVVLDILLPGIDGIKILEELKNRNIIKKSVVLSSYKDEYTIRKIQTLGVGFYMLKPFDVESLEKRIIDIYDGPEEKYLLSRKNVEMEVSSLLHELGIPSHVKGYLYIREGILKMYESDNYTSLVTKEIYPDIAEKYDTTTSRVERAIRHAIEISWVRGDLKVMNDLFGHSIDFDRAKPTNSEFLTTIADRLKLNSKVLVG